MNSRVVLVLCSIMLLAGCSSLVPSELEMHECKDAAFSYSCTADQLCGKGKCLDSDDVDNCGMVGNVCAINAMCVDGRCVCKEGDATTCGNGFVCCAGQCVDTSTNSQFCGGCNVACLGGKACEDGVCNDNCSAGLTKCDIAGLSHCVDTKSNVLNCGACGVVCGNGTACVNGACTVICPANQTQCVVDGVAQCVSVSQDSRNCGSCGRVCDDGLVCTNGICSLSCPAGQEKCSDGNGGLACADVSSNPSHCGGCGKVCPSGNVCVNGTCSLSCPSGQEMCSTNGNSKCTYVANDTSNCGSCGNACPGVMNEWLHLQSSSCSEGACVIKCLDSYEDADGDIYNGCEKSRCGNGVIESWEECDGEKLNDQTCASIMGEGSTGALRCSFDCSDFDARGCSKPTTCGNNVLDNAEVCDTYNLNNKTCADVVGKGSTGTLKCDKNCTKFDTSGCSKPTTCGNGTLDSGELCDGIKFSETTSCAKVVGTGSKGTIKCSTNCAEYDVSACSAPAVCGNGTLEEGEECDGTNMGGKNCATLMGAGSMGTLQCIGCKIVTSGCSAASTCGNNKTDGSEVCDGTDINRKTCKDIVGAGSEGTLRCADNCNSYDISSCTVAATCGDNVIQATEVCDGMKLNDHTCETQMGTGYTGKLKCNANCTGFDTSNCVAPTKCGNNTIETGEVCDGTKFKGSVTCASEVGTGSIGTVKCGSDCTFYDLSGCSAATQCGNGKLDSGEVCESGNLNGKTCADIVGKGSKGTLKCADGCKTFDTSGCSASEYCGDGTIQSGEICDGNNVGAATCVSVVGYGSTGKPSCNDTCTKVERGTCTDEVKCGNGKLDSGEVCDASYVKNPYNGATCTSLVGYGSTGSLSCQNCSKIVTTGCSPEVKCGNGKLDTGEACDFNLNGQFNGATCESIIGHGSTGTLSCKKDCTIDSSKCSPEVKCGNGKLDSNIEECDASYKADPFGGETCASLVGQGSTGSLKCTNTCEIDAGECTASAYCGNGKLDNDEACDKTVFESDISTCKYYNPFAYGQGNLKCNDNCTVDVSDCSAKCGDGILQTGEVCDDNNTNDNDGCSSNCTAVEEGWFCRQAKDGVTACMSNWCQYYWLELGDSAMSGYGRMYPATIDKPGNVFSRLICGYAYKPINTWTLGAETLGEQTLCAYESCGVNWEFMVEDLPKPQTDGDYACSFQFSMDAEHWFACSVNDNGNYSPEHTLLVENGDVLEDEYIKTFRVGNGGNGGDCDGDYETIKQWSFNKSSGSDETIYYTKDELIYSTDETRVIYSKWTTASSINPNEYVQFSVGAVTGYCAIAVKFNYSRNNSGPTKMIVSYYDGNTKIGESDPIDVNSTSPAGVDTDDLVVPIGNYNDFKVRVNGYKSKEGTLRLRDLVVKGIK